MKTEELNKQAKETLERLKPIFEDVRTVGDMIKCNANVLDLEFYLDKEDKLSNAYEQITDDYLKFKTTLKLAIASITTVIRINYKNKGEKIPGKELLENEAILEVEDLFLLEGILEGKEKTTRNWIQTCRSHINALKKPMESNEG